MSISLDQWRLSVGLFHHCIFGSKGMLRIGLNVYSVFTLILLIFKLSSCICHNLHSLFVLNFYNNQCFFTMLLLLLQSGDIETNPGPDNLHELSILHLNIRSIRNNIDFIMDNLLDFNILCFTETHLDANIPTELLFLSNCYSTPYRKDRTHHGGGVITYINSNLLLIRRLDLEVFCQESIWIKVKVHHEPFFNRFVL